jgi:lysophospholipase L1-like esterase
MCRRFALAAAVSLATAACAVPASLRSSSNVEEPVRYVALGDSYTIGTGLDDPGARWPNQVVARLAEHGVRLELVENLGVNGYTSADLIRDELPRLNELDPEFVTVLIGVNDVVQGVPENAYADNVAAILDDLLGRVSADRIVCVATPDYTVTLQGSAYGDPTQQRAAIERANELMSEACVSRGIAFVAEVHAISRSLGDDPAMLAADGLHPSGEQYARWAEEIAPVVRHLIEP